ncbi:MAG: CheR family methyltransferase [Syntrophobacteraceae bacterium]
MTSGIAEAQLSRLSEFVAARMGLHFPKERWRDLERGITAASRELGIDGKSCVKWLLSSLPTRSQIEILANHLTVGETYFFRDKKLFKELETGILARLIRSRRGGGKYLRIWCAGCSSGEEPYSVAILLNKMIPDLRDWNTTILATDISPRVLRKAADAVYGHWSFRDIEPEIKEGFFTRRDDGQFELLPRIRKMVTFSYLNLVEDTYPSLVNNSNAMDVIFCRNVLMYFVPDLAAKVARNFRRCLVDGGFLSVSPTESSNAVFPQFTRVRVPGAILYKKEKQKGPCGFSCGPPAGPGVSFKPATGFVPNRVVAPMPTPPNPQIVSPPQSPDTPLETGIPAPETQIPRDLHQEALALYDAGCYPEAVEKSENLLSQNPSDARGLALLARIHANWGKLGQALEWCEKAVTADKLYAGYHYLMATILQELGQMEDALAALKRTLYLDPEFILAYVALGNINRKCGKSKEAVKHFDNALLLLHSREPEDILPESEGITAGRLVEIVRTMRRAEIAG